MSSGAGRDTIGWFDWLFRSRETGAITIAQFPNPPLWIFLATVALRFVAPDDGAWRAGLGAVGSVALLWWAIDEIVRGVNPWRRILGAAVLLLTLVGLVGLR